MKEIIGLVSTLFIIFLVFSFINSADTNETDIVSTYTDDLGYFKVSDITVISGSKFKIPQKHIILRNYPNPFNPSTIIYFELPRSEKIELKFFI